MASFKVFSIRPARLGDCRLIWEWANDPAVRRVSFRQEPIPWEEHEAWFRQKLADNRCRYFIAVDDERPVAQVRFDIVDRQAEVHISVASTERRRGYGLQALRDGCEALGASGVRRIVAHVKPDNTASLLVFSRAGFVRDGLDIVGGQEAERLILEVAE